MSVYLALLRRPGAPGLALACVLGWIGFAATALAIVLLVEERTGSFARAGLAVGVFSAGAGLLAPVRGRLVDARGVPVLVAFAAAQCALLLLLVWTASPVVAGAAGAVAPPLIATARSVWPRIAGPELTRAGHALNALLGDVGSILGPALTGAFAAAASPGLALGVFAGGPLLGALIVARLGLEPSIRKEGQSLLRFGWTPGLKTLLIVDLCFGVAAGAIDVAGPALAEADPALAALPLVAFALGSVTGSLWAGQSQSAPDLRFVAGSCGLAAVLAACAFVTSVGALAVVLCVAGVGYGVFNVGVFELLDVVVPSHRAVEALTWLTTAGSLGMAAGAAVAGVLAHDSPRAALVLVAVGTAPGAILALARRQTLRT